MAQESAGRSQSPEGGMTCLQAALAVLETADHPMTAREITQVALEKGLRTTQGKTPERNMIASLYVEAGDNPTGRLVRIAEPGPKRMRSVRWALRTGSTDRKAAGAADAGGA